MDVTGCLSQLRSITEKSDLPTVFKKQASLALQYFIQQSQCDVDRRHRQEEIKKRWLEFESIVIGTNLLNQFRRSSGWSQVESFIGVSPNLPIPLRRKKSLEGKDVDQLLDFLVLKSEQKPIMSASEKQIVLFGLYYLQLEARRGRGQRDKKRILEAWKVIQPILRRIGLLNEFDSEPEAIRKLKSFISDRFL